MKRTKQCITALIAMVLIGSIYGQTSNNVLTPSKLQIRDGLYNKTATITRRSTIYTDLREADAMWTKRIWRVIDLRQKMNLPLYYPTSPVLERKSLFDVIKDAALEEDIIAFNNPALDDEFRTEMTRTEVVRLLIEWDSTEVEDLITGEFELTYVKEEITSEDVWKYWIKEDWFYDKQRSVLDVRILGLCPLIEKKTEEGESTGADKALFWIYFPQARPTLAKQEVYMRHNDAERRSFDDLFWKRMFSSYIRKESNVYDRVIVEYLSGIDAILESDRIRDDIFKFEHDLFHF